jgi:hypothetical protein
MTGSEMTVPEAIRPGMAGPESPIFIGGLSHSGKTPLRLVLGAHPELSMTRRTRLWDRFYGRYGDLDDAANLERCLAAVLQSTGVQQLEPDEAWLRRELARETPTYARLFGLLHQHHAAQLGCRRWGDQLGLVERYAEPIFAAFPSARMIHMIRDPRARFLDGPAARTFRQGKLGWDTAMWLRSAELAERNERRYPGRYCVVRYESFAAHPRETVDTVCAFVGEDVAPAMTDELRSILFDGAPRHPGRPTPAETAFVDRYTARELDRFGYPRPAHSLSARERLTFVLGDWPVNRAAMTVWRARERRRERA